MKVHSGFIEHAPNNYSSISYSYSVAVLCRHARLTILPTMAAPPFCSRRAHDPAMHRRWYPCGLVTAVLPTSKPSLRR